MTSHLPMKTLNLQSRCAELACSGRSAASKQVAVLITKWNPQDHAIQGCPCRVCCQPTLKRRALQVLGTLADAHQISIASCGDVRLRDLRQAVAKAFRRLSSAFFEGQDPRVYGARKVISAQLLAERQRQKRWDRKFIDNTGLRRSRLEKMQALEEEHGGDVPVLLDGVAADRGGDDDAAATLQAGTIAIPALTDAEETSPVRTGASVLSVGLEIASGVDVAAVEGAVAGGSGGAAFVTAGESDMDSFSAARKLEGQTSAAVQRLEAMADVLAGASAAGAASSASAPASADADADSGAGDGDKGAMAIAAAAAAAAGVLISAGGSGVGEGGTPGTLHEPKACYRCHARFVRLHHFYASMCPACAEVSWAKRRQTTDLRGRVAVVTGARVKIGFNVAVRLLRCGASVIIVSRFPADCAARYAAEKAAAAWGGRVHVYGVDLRATPLLEMWCAWLYRRYSHLDMIINNACQTIRRPPAYYAHLLEEELCAHERAGAALPQGQRRMLRPYFDFLRWAKIAAERGVAAADAEWEAVRERRRRRRAEAEPAVGGGAGTGSGGAALGPVPPELVGFAEEDEGLPVGWDSGAAGGGSASSDEFAGDGWKAVAGIVAPSRLGDAPAAASDAAEAGDDLPAGLSPAGSTAGTVTGPGPAAAAAATAAATARAGAPSTGVGMVVTGSGSVPLAPAPLLSQVSAAPEDALTDMSLFPKGATDVNGQQLDLRRVNSWMLRMHQVSTAEAAEVFTINALAPFVMTGKLKALLLQPAPEGNPTRAQGCSPVVDVLGKRSFTWKRDVSGEDASALAAERARAMAGNAAGPTDYEGWEVRPDRFIVQVSAMEGKFGRRKQPTHPHTNAAKAALNMMVKTSAQDYARDRVFMVAADTGWINPEQPVELAKTIAKANHFQTPIDEVDAAARILDPILAPVEARRLGKAKGPDAMPPWGVFLKDFAVSEW